MLKDEKYGVGITDYADTVVFGGDKKLVAIRFGGYPETVLAMSDALTSGSKIALKLPGETCETGLPHSAENTNAELRLRIPRRNA